jgi:cytochrome P450
MKKRHEELPVSPSALDKANLGLLFASVGNSAPAVFWTLCRLLDDAESWNACRAQVEQVVARRNDEMRTRFSLDDLDQMTLLQSAFWETLRLHSGNFTARRVVEGFELDTREGKYWIEKGSKLMSFWDVLHSDPDIFDNPDQFQYNRFVNPEQVFTYKSGKKLTHAPVMSFGGGSHLCPGRKFIGYEVRLFLAMLMLNFDMRLAEGETRPGIDLVMQGVGISHPDRDPKVEIRAIVQ